jgi:hypothetical protein
VAIQWYTAHLTGVAVQTCVHLQLIPEQCEAIALTAVEGQNEISCQVKN